MPVEIKEGGPSEDEVEAMLGRGRVRVEEAQVEEGRFGQQIRLSLMHKKGSEFRAWVSTSRSRIEEVCRCFGIRPPAKGETFDESTLVGKVGEVRISSKVDSKGSTRPKVDAWLPATEAKPAPAPVAQDGEGIPF